MSYITCPHCGETYRNITAVHVCSSGPYAVKLPADTNINTKERIRDVMRSPDDVFMDLVLETQKDAMRWWYFSVCMSEPQRNLLLQSERTQWDEMVDNWIAEYDD